MIYATQNSDTPPENFSHSLTELKDSLTEYLRLVRVHRIRYSLGKMDTDKKLPDNNDAS